MSNSNAVVNENILITLFKKADGTNLNNDSRKAATQELMKIRYKSGYPSSCLKIWQSNQPDSLREIALIQFKNNAINSFKRSGNTLEKEHCKNLLLTTYLNEKSEQITKELAQCIAKLARSEWPSNWNKLFDILVSNIKLNSIHKIYRTSIIISDILTEIASMRMPYHNKAIHKLSSLFMPILYQIWLKSFNESFNELDKNTNIDLNKLLHFLKLCLLLSRSMKVLIKRSNDLDFTNNSIGGQYLTKVLDSIQKLHDQYYPKMISHKNRNLKPLSTIILTVGKILRCLLVTVRDTHKLFTLQFRLILPSFLSYYSHVIIKHNNNMRNNNRYNNVFLNEVIVYALLFMRDVCKLQQYSGKNISGIKFNINNNNKIVFNQQHANECKLIATQFFSDDRLKKIIKCLVSDLFLLRIDDLKERSLDPTKKWSEEHIDFNDFNIRAAAKTLFRVLIKKYKDVAAPLIINMFREVNTQNNNNNNNNTQSSNNNHTVNYSSLDPASSFHRQYFLKEGVYLAFGLSYWTISPYFNKNGCSFNYIGKILSADIKLYSSSQCQIPFLIGRILWLFGKMKDDITKDINTKKYVYETILKYLQPYTAATDTSNDNNNDNNDTDMENEYLLIRLDAVESLRELLDDSQFESKEFLIYLKKTFILLLKLVEDCDASLECMQYILRIISITIKQNSSTLSGQYKAANNSNCNINSEEIVSKIFESMGFVWQQCNSTETNLCRVSLIECITNLIVCMKPVNVHKLYSSLIPMISYCTESTDDDSRICLIECGIELWHKVLYHSSLLTPEMNELFNRNWLNQMKEFGDYFDGLMNILKSYLFLGSGNFVSNNSQNIGQTLYSVVPEITDLDDAFNKISDVLCVFIQLFPTQSPKFLYSIIEHLVMDFIRYMSSNTSSTSTTKSNGNVSDTKYVNMGSINKPTYIDVNCFLPTISTHRIECYMLIFSRLLLANNDAFLSVLNDIQNKQNNQNIIKLLFKYMFIAKNKVEQIYKQKIVVLGIFRVFQNIGMNDNNTILILLSQLLSWWLQIIKDIEIEILEYADDMHPDDPDNDNISDNIKKSWTEADRISNLYCNDIVTNTFMIDILNKILNNSSNKLNVSLIQLLNEIQKNTKNNNIIKDWQYCINKYNQYLKNKQQNNDQ